MNSSYKILAYKGPPSNFSLPAVLHLKGSKAWEGEQVKMLTISQGSI